MMPAMTFKSAAMVGAVLVFAAPYAPAVVAQPNARIIQVLEVGWGKQSTSLGSARRHYETARTTSGRDARLDYAMSLVALRHRKYDEARTLLESAIVKDRTNLPAWRALVWLNMFTKKYEASLERAGALAKLYPETKARAEMEEPLRNSARWMGQLVGFLEGPAEAAVSTETLASRKKAISEELTGQWREAFNAGRQDVLDQYFQRREELASVRKQALAEETKQKADEVKSIEQDRARIARESSELKTQADAAKSEADSKVSEIDRYLEPVVRRGRDIEARASPILRNIRELRRRISRAEADERNARDDRDRRDRARREADRLRNDLRREQARLRPMEIELRRVQGEAAKLASQRVAVVGRYQATVRTIGLQQKKLDHTAKLLDKKERIVKQPATGRTPRAGDLERRLVALSTYRTFPLDAARAALLESLRQ